MKAIALPIEVKVEVVVVIVVEVVLGGAEWVAFGGGAWGEGGVADPGGGGAEGVAVIVKGWEGGEISCGGEGGKYEEDYEEGDGEFHGFGVCCFLFCSESILAERKGLCLGLMGKNNDSSVGVRFSLKPQIFKPKHSNLLK